MVSMCIFVEYTCVQNMTEKVTVVEDILENNKGGHFYGTPCTCSLIFQLHKST